MRPENGSMSGKLSAIRKQIFSTKAEDNCRVLYDAQQLASKVGNRPEELEKLAEQLCRKKSSSQRKPGAVSCR